MATYTLLRKMFSDPKEEGEKKKGRWSRPGGMVFGAGMGYLAGKGAKDIIVKASKKDLSKNKALRFLPAAGAVIGAGEHYLIGTGRSKGSKLHPRVRKGKENEEE